MNEIETCGVCGGDGRINTGSQTSKCPACHGSGRRSEQPRFRDVTKTKPSHHHPAVSKNAEKTQGPVTAEGKLLAKEVAATDLPDKEKARLTQSIVDYENRKGQMTKTFSRLIRKQIRTPE
jgi:DnaJ-class molecular chaperone